MPWSGWVVLGLLVAIAIPKIGDVIATGFVFFTIMFFGNLGNAGPIQWFSKLFGVGAANSERAWFGFIGLVLAGLGIFFFKKASRPNISSGQQRAYQNAGIWAFGLIAIFVLSLMRFPKTI